MDRNNNTLWYNSVSRWVATREGGVDRNQPPALICPHCGRSPPARVAWIETLHRPQPIHYAYVATREGGVDRNCDDVQDAVLQNASPPARVAWVETTLCAPANTMAASRHPRGWRG